MRNPISGRRRWRRILAVVLLSLVAIEAAWLVVANRQLSSGAVLARLGARPERLRVAWTSARSWYPGHVAVRDLEVSGGSRVSEWHVTCDRGSFRVATWPLLFRRVAVRDAEMGRVSVRVRTRPKPGMEPELTASWPPIPGKPGRPEPRPPPRTDDWKPWDVDVDDARIEDLAEAWVNALRIEGAGRLRASAKVRPRRWFSLPSVEWRATTARMSVGGVPVLRSLEIDADARIDRWPYREEHGRAGLDHLSGRCELSGEDLSLDFLRWLRFSEITPRLDGPGNLEIEARIEDGRLLPGTTAGFTAARCGVQVLRVDVGGRVAAQARVLREQGKDVLQAQARFTDIEVRRSGEPEAAGTGAAATIDLAWQSPALSSSEPVRKLVVECPDISVPDMARLNPLLPRGAHVRFVDGSAEAGLRLELQDGRSGRGHLDLRARGVALDLPGGTRCRGDVDFVTDPVLKDVENGITTYDGTTLRLANLVLAGRDSGEPWSLDLEAVHGRTNLAAGDLAEADLAFRMTDLRPLKAAAGEGLPGALRMVPNIRDLSGTAHLLVRDELVEVEHLEVTGRAFELRMNLRVESSRPSGIAFARWKIFQVGLELDGGGRDWKLTRAREWFVERTQWKEAAVPAAAP